MVISVLKFFRKFPFNISFEIESWNFCLRYLYKIKFYQNFSPQVWSNICMWYGSRWASRGLFLFLERVQCTLDHDNQNYFADNNIVSDRRSSVLSCHLLTKYLCLENKVFSFIKNLNYWLIDTDNDITDGRGHDTHIFTTQNYLFLLK